MSELWLDELKTLVGGNLPERHRAAVPTLGFICLGVALYALFRDNALGVFACTGGLIPIAIELGRRSALTEVRAILEATEKDALRRD